MKEIDCLETFPEQRLGLRDSEIWESCKANYPRKKLREKTFTTSSLKGADMRYEIKGKVIDQEKRAGVAGVRVEAWGKDREIDDDLGHAATLDDGSFAIWFDEDTFRDFFHDRYPDIY